MYLFKEISTRKGVIAWTICFYFLFIYLFPA